MLSIWFCILFYFIFCLFLFIYFITVWIDYSVWYTIVLIDHLQFIHLKIHFQIILHLIGYYELYNRRILVLKKTCLGNSTDWLGHFILLFKNNCLISLNNKSFIIWVFFCFFADHYSNHGHSVFVKYWVAVVSIFALCAVYLLKPIASYV